MWELFFHLTTYEYLGIMCVLIYVVHAHMVLVVVICVCWWGVTYDQFKSIR